MQCCTFNQCKKYLMPMVSNFLEKVWVHKCNFFEVTSFFWNTSPHYVLQLILGLSFLLNIFVQSPKNWVYSVEHLVLQIISMHKKNTHGKIYHFDITQTWFTTTTCPKNKLGVPRPVPWTCLQLIGGEGGCKTGGCAKRRRHAHYWGI
jgi:hypothetical protein